MIKLIIFLILIIFAFKGCTKDDICPEGEATTPNLVITFNNIANPTERKKVNVLSIQTDYENPVEVLPRTNTDSIAIPLSTTSDTTKYQIIRSIFRTNDTLVNVDKIMFVYNRENGYVNRACGFKTEFTNLQVSLQDEGTENWIEQVIKKRDTVNDENSAHVTLLH